MFTIQKNTLFKKLAKETQRPLRQLQKLIHKRKCKRFFEDRRLYNPCSTEEQKSALKKYLIMVSVEIFSYCNRRCEYCPNSIYDRHSSNHHLDENLYLKLLEELASINYSDYFDLNNFNEPLADKVLITRIKQCKEYLPNAFLHINTNGDYLTPEYLEELYLLGVSSLCISLHINEKEIYSHESAEDKIFRFANKLRWKNIFKIQNSEIHEYIKYYHDKMFITVRAPNWNENEYGTGRGILEQIDSKHKIRTTPCYAPSRMIIITHQGNYMPCCTMCYEESPLHQTLKFGNIRDNTIFEIFNSTSAVNTRKLLKQHGEMKLKPCLHCRLGYFDDIGNMDYSKKEIISQMYNFSTEVCLVEK